MSSLQIRIRGRRGALQRLRRALGGASSRRGGATASDGFEASQIEALLADAGIRFFRRYPLGTGRTLSAMGGPVRGPVDLYVPLPELDRAREQLYALGRFAPAGSPLSEERDSGPDPSGERRLRRLVGWMLILVFIGSTLAVSSGQIIYFVRLLWSMAAG